MKIRELEIYGLRNFPPEGRRISFVDPYSDRPRQLTVLVGSNGSGKTSVLDAITTLVARLGMEPGVGDRLRQARSHFSGIIAMELGKKLRDLMAPVRSASSSVMGAHRRSGFRTETLPRFRVSRSPPMSCLDFSIGEPDLPRSWLCHLHAT
ncbi:MAG: AAA family ATPase [bacterium]